MMHYIQPIVDFFNHPFFIVVGGLATFLVVFGIIYRIVCWALGITPILFRLGTALWGRDIAIFAATSEAYDSLRTTLVDSGVFRQSNIEQIAPENIVKAKTKSIFLVDWETFNDHIMAVFDARPTHQTPVIISAKPGGIPPETMAKIANLPNTVVVNFRGRLLNDILTSLMTTSYAKK